MTYSSSAERITCGFGRPLVCGLAWTSSRMMSLHRSTHSSQMYTEGPAMSLRTSCSLLPQKEQYRTRRSEEHTSELQSLMRISYAVFCLKKKTINKRI